MQAAALTYSIESQQFYQRRRILVNMPETIQHSFNGSASRFSLLLNWSQNRSTTLWMARPQTFSRSAARSSCPEAPLFIVACDRFIPLTISITTVDYFLPV